MSLGLITDFVPSHASVECGCEDEEEFYTSKKDRSVVVSVDFLKEALHPCGEKDLGAWRHSIGYRGFVMGYAVVDGISYILLSSGLKVQHPNCSGMAELEDRSDLMIVSEFLIDHRDLPFLLVKLNRIFDVKPKENHYLPHTCTRCASPAYITFLNVECSNAECFCYIKPRAI